MSLVRPPRPAFRRANRVPAEDAGPTRSRDDLAALNGLPSRRPPWGTALPADQGDPIEAQVRREIPVRDDFVTIPFPRLASTSNRPIAQAVDSYKREAAIVDPRLAHEVTCAFKATALSDLCDQLRAETGIGLTAGPSVADEKLTVFCEKLPLREVMRQLSRPFGYSWLRTKQAFRRSGVQAFGTDAVDLNARTPERLNAAYRYELVQDLRSQLLEEELRNRDRDAALLALEQKLERFRPYLDLSPEEALARARTASPEEKPLLEEFAGRVWGAVQMYYRLLPQQMAAVRAGQELQFRVDPGPKEQALPPDIARGVLQSQRDWRFEKVGEHYRIARDLNGNIRTDPDTLPLTAIPGARGTVGLNIDQTELGRFALYGQIGLQIIGSDGKSSHDASTGLDYFGGTDPAVHQPENAAANARLAREPALRARVTVQPQPDLTPLHPLRGYPASLQGKGESPGLTSDHGSASPRPPSPSRGGAGGGVGLEPKVTTADVLEALHRATGMPIVSDFYTRLYKPDAVSVRNEPLFVALNQLADVMRLRWNKEGEWLQFRSISYYNDRLKEVPNRLLARWAAARRRQGILTLDDLVEIPQLPDAQLNGAEMGEGAREGWGLAEWDLATNGNLREAMRFLAGFTPARRQQATSAVGLPFTDMPLAQQQRFLVIALGDWMEPLKSLDELAGAALRVEYTQPGWFQWQPQGALGYPMIVPLERDPHGRRALLPSARARTREAALAAARQIDPQLREGVERLDAAHREDPKLTVTPAIPQEDRIVPTRRELWFVYFLGPSNPRPNLIRGLQDRFYY